MIFILQLRFVHFAGVLALMLLAGCAVGPNFKKPAAPPVSGYTANPLSTTSGVTNVAGGEAQRFVEGLDIPGEWWKLFHSQPLNDLIERSLTNNPSLKAAQAALAMARENLLAQKGAFWPGADASFYASRQRTSEALAPIPNANEFYFNLYTPQVSISYVPDVFGLNRRTVETFQAQEQQVRFALIATYITLSANVAEAAIQEASLRAQIDATRQLIVINSNMVQILRAQFAKGYASRLDLAAQESQLAQVAAALPPLLKQLAQQRDLLATLSGGFPSEAIPEEFELSSLQLPQDLPMSVPSRFVNQRPDVRQAEETLHAASAQIGIATAEPAAERHAHGQHWHHGTGNQPDVRLRRGLLDFGGRCDAAHLRRRRLDAPGARRQGGLRAGRRTISQHRAKPLFKMLPIR